jgi:hypothetical protein
MWGIALAAAIAALSPAGQRAIATVHQAIEKVRAEQTLLAPPASPQDNLKRMMQLDQAPRDALGAIDFSKIPATERDTVGKVIWAEIKPIDDANVQALLAMLPPDGWFIQSRYGEEASLTNFLILQHSNVALWRRFVPVLEKLAAKGEVKGGYYALMYDRLAIHEGRSQRYGSQMHCVEGRQVPLPIEDPAHLDELRAKLGMKPYKDYLAEFANDPPC